MGIERKALIVAGACFLAGCATGPTPARQPSTQYKGDAVWNISLRDAARWSQDRGAQWIRIDPCA